jgi:hypothetical protein
MSDFESKYRGWHTKMSYFKSAVRIVGCLAILMLASDGDLINLLACSFLVGEVIGILEEIV